MFDLEVGLPIDAPYTPTARVLAGELPATTVARTVYRGGYEGLAAACEEFDASIAAGGRRVAQDLWERHVRGPGSGPDPPTDLTGLKRPLLRRSAARGFSAA